MLQKYADTYRRRNYEIFTAIDMIKLSCVLAEMIKDGSITLDQSKHYHNAAESLVHLIGTANQYHFENLKE